ncbi:hypothetical protein MCACP_11400 [Neomoorella carbonis]
MMFTLIFGILSILLGILQLIRPARVYTDKPEVQVHFRPGRFSSINILLSLALIGFGIVLLYSFYLTGAKPHGLPGNLGQSFSK